MIEAGKRDITVSALFKISRALNVTMKEIFAFDNTEKFKFDIEKIYEEKHFKNDIERRFSKRS